MDKVEYYSTFAIGFRLGLIVHVYLQIHQKMPKKGMEGALLAIQKVEMGVQQAARTYGVLKQR